MKALWILAFIVLMPVGARAADEFAACILCHGTNANGNAAVRAPRIAGMERWYLLRQLRMFRAGTRGMHALDVSGSEMRTVALTLREATVEKAVDYIGNLKAKPAAVTIKGDATKGLLLYASCAACHGARGAGNESLGAPALAGGSDWYWVVQINNYRNRLRGADSTDSHASAMRAAAAALPDANAVLDVVAYVNTLR